MSDVESRNSASRVTKYQERVDQPKNYLTTLIKRKYEVERDRSEVDHFVCWLYKFLERRLSRPFIQFLYRKGLFRCCDFEHARNDFPYFGEELSKPQHSKRDKERKSSSGLEPKWNINAVPCRTRNACASFAMAIKRSASRHPPGKCQADASSLKLRSKWLRPGFRAIKKTSMGLDATKIRSSFHWLSRRIASYIDNQASIPVLLIVKA
jgi:hypothetical protein